ncbi:hypothetical protein HY988_05765 [Candidatus Micrarchaeota archaeon]|nr:hypothetical protein [Candidatus Micrarchaeota archaeon]
MALPSIFAVGLMAFLLASCSLVDFVTNLSKAFAPPPEPSFNNSPITPGGGNTSNASPKIEQQWASITKFQAEKGCLKQAKKIAVQQGASASFVFSCTCAAEENDQTKTYDCSVNAIDGSHKVGIMCVKTQNQCAVTSEAGTQSFNFDQLEQFANG